MIAQWNRRLDQLVVTSSAQMPHITRAGLAECLGIDQGQVRVVAPDVGGGFGYKGILLPEEVALAGPREAAACRCAGSRTGASSSRPTPTAASTTTTSPPMPTPTAGCWRSIARPRSIPAPIRPIRSLPAWKRRRSARILPGLYELPQYRCRTWSVATNKPPILPYRGVARTGVCFALEVMLDALAPQRGHRAERAALMNLVPPEQMPFDNIAKALRLRRLSRGPAARRRGDRLREMRARQTARRAGRPPHRRRLGHVLRAGRARHDGLLRLGHPDGAGQRAVPGAPDAGRRARAAHRRALPRPGHGDDAGAGGARGARHAARTSASFTATPR